MESKRRELGKRLKQARLALGLSGEDIGDNFGGTRSAVYQWETGKTSPTIDKLKRLSEILNVDFNWLISGEGEGPAAVKTNEKAGARRSVVRRAQQLIASGTLTGMTEGIPEIDSRLLDPKFKNLRDIKPRKYWNIPPTAVDYMHADRDDLVVMRHATDELKPTISFGDYVFINTSLRVIRSTRYIWAVSDGAAFLFRYIDPIAARGKVNFRLYSADNNKVPDRTIRAPDLIVYGRVVGVLKAL